MVFQERYGNLVSEHFAQYTTARTLRVALSERKPPIIVTDGMLKIRFAKFRLSSDAVTVSSAEELHRRYGDILPALAAQNPTAYRLMRVLKARTPPLYVSDAVLKQWFLRYFDAEPISDDAPAEPPRKRAATASVSIEGAAGIEAACGERYLREVSDLGLGLVYRVMREKLESWGYAVTREGCTVWLQQYRLVTKAKDGNHAVYAASKAHTAR